jgi:hypothetical protein
MKKVINYSLQAIKLNKGMSYKTTDKLKFGSTIFIDGILWRITGINN